MKILKFLLFKEAKISLQLISKVYLYTDKNICKTSEKTDTVIESKGHFTGIDSKKNNAR